VNAQIEIVTRTARMWLGNDGIIHNVDLPGLDHSLVDAEENVAAYSRIWAGTRRPLLVDMTQVKSISREARACYATQTHRYISAVALVVGSPLSRMIANFFLGLNRTAQPTRLFRTVDEAAIWLRPFLTTDGAVARGSIQ